MKRLLFLVLCVQIFGQFGYQGGGGGSQTPTGVLEVGANQTYTTINSALSAASSGNEIVVYPGVYEEQITPKDGIRMFFHPGARVIAKYNRSIPAHTYRFYCVGDTNTITGTKFSIYGKGTFGIVSNATSDTAMPTQGGVVIWFQKANTIYFEADTVFCSVNAWGNTNNGNFTCISTGNNAENIVFNARVNVINGGSNKCVNPQDASKFSLEADIITTMTDTTANASIAVYMQTDQRGRAVIKAKKILSRWIAIQFNGASMKNASVEADLIVSDCQGIASYLTGGTAIVRAKKIEHTGIAQDNVCVVTYNAGGKLMVYADQIINGSAQSSLSNHFAVKCNNGYLYVESDSIYSYKTFNTAADTSECHLAYVNSQTSAYASATLEINNSRLSYAGNKSPVAMGYGILIIRNSIIRTKSAYSVIEFQGAANAKLKLFDVYSNNAIQGTITPVIGTMTVSGDI